jgi:hypothetical protein
MRKRYAVAVGAAAVVMGITAIAVPTVASASSRHHGQNGCAAGMHAAVVEDNAAYNARDPERYEAALNPKMIFFYDGAVTYGRDGSDVRPGAAVPAQHQRLVEVEVQVASGDAARRRGTGAGTRPGSHARRNPPYG